MSVSHSQSLHQFEQMKGSLRRVFFWGMVSIGLSLFNEWLRNREEHRLQTAAAPGAPASYKANPGPPKPQRPSSRGDIVDYASDQSFPASDPPAWH